MINQFYVNLRRPFASSLTELLRNDFYFLQAFCLSGSVGRTGGATPGKALLGLRVVTASAVISVEGRPKETVLLYPGRPLSFNIALFRSLMKNFLISLLFPLCLVLFVFRHNRTGYDLLCGVIVVEENMFPPRRHAPWEAWQLITYPKLIVSVSSISLYYQCYTFTKLSKFIKCNNFHLAGKKLVPGTREARAFWLTNECACFDWPMNARFLIGQWRRVVLQLTLTCDVGEMSDVHLNEFCKARSWFTIIDLIRQLNRCNWDIEILQFFRILCSSHINGAYFFI